VVEQYFWGRGYMVSTLVLDEKAIRDYIRNQEAEDQRIEQMQISNRGR
jgi:putative transposase